MRRIDELGEKNYATIKSRFKFISSIQVKSWKFFFIASFAIGMITATVWGYTTGKFNQSSACSKFNPLCSTKNAVNNALSGTVQDALTPSFSDVRNTVTNPVTIATGTPVVGSEYAPSASDLNKVGQQAADSIKNESEDFVNSSINPISAAAGTPTPTGKYTPSVSDVVEPIASGNTKPTNNTPTITTLGDTNTGGTTTPITSNGSGTTNGSGTNTNTNTTPTTPTVNTPSNSVVTPVSGNTTVTPQNSTPVSQVSTPTQVNSNSSSKKSSDKKSSDKYVIKNSKKTVTKGEILVQSGKKFSKSEKVYLYFENSSHKFAGPVAVTSDKYGSFSTSYKVSKPAGTYRWYAYDAKSGSKSDTISYRVK